MAYVVVAYILALVISTGIIEMLPARLLGSVTWLATVSFVLGLLLTVVGLWLGVRTGPGRRWVLSIPVLFAVLLGEAAVRLVVTSGLTAERSDIMASALSLPGGPWAAMLVVALTVVLPLGEELVFRGALWRAMEPAGRHVALVGTSTCYVIARADPAFVGQMDVAHVIAAVPVALYLGWLRQVTGGVWACVFANAIVGAAAILSARFALQVPSPGIVAAVTTCVLLLIVRGVPSGDM